MADEQIIVDIKVDSKDVNQAEKSIDRLTDSIEELGNQIIDTKKQNKLYKEEQKDINKLYEDGKISSEKYEKEIGKLNGKIKANNKQIAQSSIELSKQKRERSANIKLINSESGSRDKLRQKIAILNREYSELNQETEEGKKKSKELQKELSGLTEELNDGSLAAGNFKDNIGNYPEATDKAKGGINILGGALDTLRANPILFFVTALFGILSALFSAFKKSENGAKLLDKAGAALSGVMMVLTSVMNTLAGALTKAFEDPQQAVKDLWESIKTNIVNRIEGVIVLFKALGNIDFTNLKESLGDVGTALTQINTGLDADQQKEMADNFNKIKQEAADLAEKMVNLAAAQRALRGQSRTLQKDIAVLSAEFEMLAEIAGDDTRNMQEMRQAAIDAGNAAAELAQKQEQLAQIRLKTISQEVAVRQSAGEDIQDLLDQQAEAEVALTEAKSQAAIAQQKILIEQRKIERDIFEQNLDILLDIGDKIKTAQEKAIQNESLSLEKRKQLLEASKVAQAANFAAIKKEYELYGVTVEQINEVITASDAKQTNEKLKALGLNEIANNRLREIVMERRQGDLDYNDLQKELSDEELERKEAANDKIKELSDEAALSQIETSKELATALIDLEKAKLETLLEDETLLEIERQALILESEATIQEIEREFAEEKKETEAEDLEERKELLQNFFSDIIGITQQFGGEELAVFGKIGAGIAKAFEDGKITAENAIQGIGMASNAVFSAISARRAKDLEENESARAAELALHEGNEIAQDEINKKFDEKNKEIKLKQFNADKAKAVTDIAIQGALAVTKSIAASPLTFGLPWSAIVGGLALGQGAFVAAQKPPTFAGGTNDIVNIGGSHASGNDVDVWGYSGNNKQYFGKVEKGEAMPVIKKSAANDYMISRLNGRHGGTSKRKFADGTPDITNQDTSPQNNENLVNSMVAAFSNVKIVAKIEDITKAANSKIEIVDNSKV